MVTLQSQPENVLPYAQDWKKALLALGDVPGVEAKQVILGKRSLEDAVNNTFSVSYVGNMLFGSLESHIDSMFNVTDGSTYKTVFIEVSSLNGFFDIAFLQGFSSDVYYRAFLKQLEKHGLDYTEMGSSPLGTPGMVLP